MKLFFARHGESEANVLRVISNRDVPHMLTRLGIEQVGQLAESLKGENIRHVYASPIPRARQTAEIVSSALGVSFTLSDGLREFDCGVLEGRGDPAAWDQHLGVIQQWYEAGNPAARIEGGESLVEVQNRFLKTLDFVERTHSEAQEAVLLVSHGALLYSMMPTILSNVSRDRVSELGLTNTTLIEVSSSNGARVCVRWNSYRF